MARSGNRAIGMATPVFERGGGHCVALSADTSRRSPSLNPRLRTAGISRDPTPQGATPMDQPFDLLLTGGTVVNQDGAHEADLGIRDGRVAAIGDLSRAEAPRAAGDR